MQTVLRKCFKSDLWSSRPGPKAGGFITLVTVVIIGLLLISLGLAVSFRSLGETMMSAEREAEVMARTLASACVEEALLRLKLNPLYGGGESIVVRPGETCDILPVGGAGNINRSVEARAAIREHTKNIRVFINRLRPITEISSWREMP
jgi:hypothetical protein